MSDRHVAIGLRYATTEQLREALEARTGEAWFPEASFGEAFRFDRRKLTIAPQGFNSEGHITLRWRYLDYEGNTAGPLKPGPNVLFPHSLAQERQEMACARLATKHLYQLMKERAREKM